MPRAGGTIGEQPSLVRFPIGVHASPSAIARDAFGGIAQAQWLRPASGTRNHGAFLP